VDDLTSACGTLTLRGSRPALATSLVGEALSLFGWLQNLERAHERFVDTHHSTCIIEFTTVIWSREESNKLPPSEKLVAVLNDLMGTANQI
jgi:hypothetical protein